MFVDVQTLNLNSASASTETKLLTWGNDELKSEIEKLKLEIQRIEDIRINICFK